MTAIEKIEESEYNLEKLKKPWPSDKEFLFELSNFLCSANSIFSHLLADFSKKFELRLEKMYPSEFKDKAKSQNNQEAIDFIHWYQDQYNRIKQNKEYGFLIDKRNLNVHKETLKLPPPESSTSSTEVTMFWGKAIVPERGIYWMYDENPNAEVAEVCEAFLIEIKRMVNDSNRFT